MMDLQRCLKYRNKAVVTRFSKLFAIPEKESNEIFLQCIRWLWLCANAAEDRRNKVKGVPPKLAIDRSVLIIDEMWHNFLCFTKDYSEFCSRYFGFFIHHNPTTKRFNENLKRKIDVDMNFQRDRRQVQYEYTVRKLGVRTFQKWYVEYEKKFTASKIRKLRLN